MYHLARYGSWMSIIWISSISVTSFSGRNQSLFDENIKVEKFDLTPEQYDSRTDTVKAFLVRNKLGKYNEEERKKMEADKAEAEAAELSLAQAIHVGDRCEVTVPNALPKRGVVRNLSYGVVREN